MLGKRQAQRDLFDVGNVFPVALGPTSFHGQLAPAADRLFRDEDFAALSADRLGRSSTPPFAPGSDAPHAARVRRLRSRSGGAHRF